VSVTYAFGFDTLTTKAARIHEDEKRLRGRSNTIVGNGLEKMKLLFIFGTRPETVKMALLAKEVLKHRDRFDARVCVPTQHREMLDQVMKFFPIVPDYDLNLTKPNQSLFDVTADGLKGLASGLRDYGPEIVFVQGDATTVFIGALAGFCTKAKVAHLEDGLRSGNKYSPYSEEMNRVLAGHLADYHFAPTKRTAENLMREGIGKNIWVTGNTVIDALFLYRAMIKEADEGPYYNFFHFVDFSGKIILVTGHRRESFGEPFENICRALKEITLQFSDVEIIYPVHLNPNVRRPVNEILNGHDRPSY
jgi:UDP-N-acetylglucosamine 2-epimerase (non-hydrolysing)